MGLLLGVFDGLTKKDASREPLKGRGFFVFFPSRGSGKPAAFLLRERSMIWIP
jgi:hypothetical protein